jgi:hypothetical protein
MRQSQSSTPKLNPKRDVDREGKVKAFPSPGESFGSIAENWPGFRLPSDSKLGGMNAAN